MDYQDYVVVTVVTAYKTSAPQIAQVQRSAHLLRHFVDPFLTSKKNGGG